MNDPQMMLLSGLELFLHVNDHLPCNLVPTHVPP